MRVVFMSSTRQVWGAEVSLLTLASALAGNGVDVALVCLPGELPARARDLGVHDIYVARPSEVTGRHRLGETARLWRAYVREARQGDRLVLFSYFLLAFAPLLRPFLRARGVRVTLDLHDQLQTRKAQWAVRTCARACDAVIACSRFTARQVNGHPKVSFLHRPVNADAVVPVSAGRGFGAGRPFRVGIVGRISEEKRHPLLIEAVRRLGDEAELVVRGGDDGSSARYVGQVLDQGRRTLGGRFVEEGRVAPERSLDDLDVVVVGNPAEPMGRTVIEAQTRGVVAVVPDSGGSHELVEDGVTGMVYAHDDAEDLARVLRRVAQDQPLAARIAQESAQHVTRPVEYARAYRARLG